MACKSCQKSKQLKINTSQNIPVVQSIYNNNDFQLGLWIGEDNIDFIGTNTGIKYGKKMNGSRVLIHSSDLPNDNIDLIG